MKYLSFLLAILINATTAGAQESILVSGPMQGYVEYRTATLWAEFSQKPEGLTIEYLPSGSNVPSAVQINLNAESTFEGNIVMNNQYGHYIAKFHLTNLSPQTTYNYSISVGKKKKTVVATGKFTTQTFWQWRTPVPDFSFIAGSCSYFNQPEHDRLQGKNYGGDSTIFETMAKEKAAFMLWLGDNWYTRVPDYFSEWGLYYRASNDRSKKVLQPFLQAMPHMAIWDDHDYGPNDAGSSYALKSASREVFNNYWCNPSAGNDGQGIYTQFSWNDVDFFLLDDRWFRSNDDMTDSIDGSPNKEKQMFGPAQLTWLKNALLQSNNNPNISFRFIVSGSQILNPLSPYDCLRHFSAEFQDLFSFINNQNIKGLIFLTGDRHHSEIIKMERPDSYTLFDITSSPLTSGIGFTREPEKSSPYRVSKETDAQNFARLSFAGPLKQRKLLVEFIGIDGSILDSWGITLQDLGVKKKE